MCGEMPVLFTCERNDSLRLTESACASQFHRARREKPERWHPLSRCLGCPVGATHAGVPVQERRSAPIDDWGCLRCGKTHMRLWKGRICVSCYNREREVRIGRNARGTAPVKARLPLPYRLAVQAKQVEVEAVHLLEAMLSTVRVSRQSVALARPIGEWPTCR